MKNTLLKRALSLITACTVIFSLSACAATVKDGGKAGNNYAAGNYYDGALSGEGYTEITENNFVNTLQNPNSYFSIDANTASYPNLRSLIKNGYSIPKDAVRVEEMLNYFTYDYDAPNDGEVLSLTSSVLAFKVN